MMLLHFVLAFLLGCPWEASAFNSSSITHGKRHSQGSVYQLINANFTARLDSVENEKLNNTSHGLEEEHADALNDTLLPVYSSSGSPSGVTHGRQCATNDCHYFDYTPALRLGIRFQKEFCQNLSRQNISDFVASQDCPQNLLSCATYSTDINVDKITKHGNVSSPKHEARTQIPDGISRRVEYQPSHYVTVIVSCPRNIYLADNATPLVDSYFIDDSGIDESNTTLRQALANRCDECMERNDSIALVTSGVSGLTYCNSHCLACHEHLLPLSNTWRWRKTRKCRMKDTGESRKTPVAAGNAQYEDKDNDNSSSIVSKISLTEVCWVEFKPMSIVVARNPITDSSVFESVINSGDFDLLENVDQEPRTLESLCRSYIWPVYTERCFYRNLFCYLCKQSKESELFPQTSFSDGSFSIVRPISVGILTDLRDFHHDTRLLADDEQFVFHPDFDDEIEGNDDVTSDTSDESPISLSTCSEGFWFNYLNSQCTSIQCSHGQNLTSSAVNKTELQCRFPDKEELNVTGDSLYILKLLWYAVDNDTKNDENVVEFDSEDDFGASNKSHMNKIPFFCDSYKKHSQPIGVVENDNYFLQGGEYSIPSGFDANDASFSQMSSSSSSSSFLESDDSMSSEAHGQNYPEKTLDFSIVNQTDWTLRHLNISSFLLRIALPDTKMKGKERNQSGLPVARKVVVYFKTTLGGNKNKLNVDIVTMFSNKVNITRHDGKPTEFRSVLLQKHDRPQDTESDKYFISTDELADEIDVKTFSKTLSTMACSHGSGSANPTIIHLVSACPHVLLNGSSFNVTLQQTLIHKEMNLRLQRHQYVRSTSRVLVCVAILDSHVKRQAMKSHLLLLWVETVLTLTLLPISMVCLLMTFATYCMFPVLRSMPGKNNMFLVFWLFWAQALILLNLLAPKNTTACIVMGIILHYSWLVTLAWTCVCSFHMFNVFVIKKGTPNVNRSHRWYVAFYSLLSHVIPLLVIVVVSVTSRYSTTDGSIGYGGVICYLESSLLVGLAFVLPLALILVMNMAFFFSTIHAISRIEKIKRQTGNERRNVHIYARLSSLTSATWVLALLAQIPGCQSLSVLSVTVNSCQGIFLFISYIVNKRVKRLWIKKGRGDRNSRSSTSGTSTTKLTTTNSVV